VSVAAGCAAGTRAGERRWRLAGRSLCDDRRIWSSSAHPHRDIRSTGLAKLMGYRVTVVDARAKFRNQERFPDADELIVRVARRGDVQLNLDNSTYVVILTHDPKFDLPALRSVLGKDSATSSDSESRKTNQNRLRRTAGPRGSRTNSWPVCTVRSASTWRPRS